MSSYLDEIVASARRRASRDHRDLDELLSAALSLPKARSFQGALQASNGLAVVAEIKRRSPSKGDMAAGIDVARVAKDYAAGGAACLSVLTNEEFFGGSREDLVVARGVVDIPVLRKDFTVSPFDICDARLMGADAVLLIVAALGYEDLVEYIKLVEMLGMDALVEVHDELELDKALSAGARVVGVNRRDLHSFDVHPDRAVKLAKRIPPDITSVAESGISTREDAQQLFEAGFNAVLVGELLMRSVDRTTAVKSLSSIGAQR
ncbi:MAG: indole-3-glycerol phosphate synthase TrpC [Actinobacteria bacterium]|nr:indole-3-glycerol phosphate synthase TrpC [Actinomycetota bacterium]MCL6095516.1 indole-3-glycerol phosphate synthase TrpC [Actinomycetota bacterium]